MNKEVKYFVCGFATGVSVCIAGIIGGLFGAWTFGLFV